MNIVEFPGLGLKFILEQIAFTVSFGDFNLPIFWYGIIIATAFLVAVVLGIRASRKLGFEPDNVIDLVLFAAPVAIIGARLYYVIFKWSDFKDNPIDILDFRSGGLAIYGGIIGGILTAYVFARVKKLDIRKLFDFGSPYLVLAQGIGRWGNFVNAEAHGGQTSLPWGMKINGAGPYHPTFLYEFLWDFAVFALLIWYRKRKKVDGEVFFLYMILYGIGRMFIEGLRTDSLYLGPLRISQVLAFLFAAIFTVVFFVNRKKAFSSSELSEPRSSEYSSVLNKMRQADQETRHDDQEIGKDGQEARQNEQEMSQDILSSGANADAPDSHADTTNSEMDTDKK